ncbi:MAG: tRNA 2-thiouridine(34) synthase MnmA [Desulfomonilaceae bacterium]
MKVGVAMSGGVDSTAAALLLKEQGHDVVGFHIYMHEYSAQSWSAVQEIARRVEIPITMVDLRRDFQEVVISHFVGEYARGRTPSPCLVCNKVIKMGLLRDHALRMGCDKLATGHYAQIIQGAGGAVLRRGIDPKKDQAYFLAMVSREDLDTVILPLGTMTKSQTREMLRKRGIFIPDSADSQELCFIRGQTYREYLLERKVTPQPGPIVDIRGRRLGTHPGIESFTVGQRRGLRISAAQPLYIVAIDAKTHTIVVGPAEHAVIQGIEVEEFNRIRETPISVGETMWVKVRSTSAPTLATVESVDENTLNLRFHNPQRGVAPGQAAVLYTEDQVVGGGWIRATAR